MSIEKEKPFGNESISYHDLLHNEMLPVIIDHKDWHNDKVERLYLEGMVDNKWVEDCIAVERQAYDTFTDEDGGVFIMNNGLKQLVQAPDTFYYRIPEDTDEIAETAFVDATSLGILDVPYKVDSENLEKALAWIDDDITVNRYDWSYDNTISDELIVEIANGWTDEFGFVYSQDRKRLLKAANVEEYYILEGVEKIERLAFVGTTFKTLHIPYTCRPENIPEAEYPVFGSDRVAGEVIPWCMPYHYFVNKHIPIEDNAQHFLDLDNSNIRMMSDLQKDPNDLFSNECHLTHLKFYCSSSDMSIPRFWVIKPADRFMGYAISLHLSEGKNEDHYETDAVFVTNDLASMKNRMTELSLLRFMKQELRGTILLSYKADASGCNDSILRAAGFEKTSARWHDKKGQEYEVFSRPRENLKNLDQMMKRVEQLGRDLIFDIDYAIQPKEFDFFFGDDGSEYRMRDGIKILQQVPNVPSYRVSEDVMEIKDYALELCSKLRYIDMPYTISDYNINKVIDNCHYPVKCHKWDWPYDCSISEELQQEIDEGWTDEQGFVYSQDRKRLLKAAPEVGEYWIPEGVEKIERLAFVHCHFETLHIPYTCHLHDLPNEEWPVFGREDIQGCDLIWDRPYAEQDLVTDSLYVADDDHVEDEYGVVYTKNMKRLLHAKSPYDGPDNKIAHMTEYTVPEGVETICSFAFLVCKEFLTLRLPHTIKVIGDNLFGEEGGEMQFYPSATCAERTE